VKLPFVPGPSDVISAVEGVRGGVSEALALVPRLGTLVGRLESLLDRVTTVVDRVEGVVDRADGVVTAVEQTRCRADGEVSAVERTRQRADAAIDAVGATQQKADAAIDAVGATQQKADATIDAVGATQQKADAAVAAVGGTLSRADGTVTHAEGLLARVDPLVDVFQEPLMALAPAVRRLAATLEPHEVEAMVTFIDRLPRLMQHLDEDVLPVLSSMGNVGPDIHDLLDTMQDLRHVVKGFPGSRLFRRRGAEEVAEDEEREAADDQEPGLTGS
jgi:hypothetical protein